MSDNRPASTQNTSRNIQKRWLLIAGGIMLFFGIYISAFLLPDVVRSASGPQALTLEEAAEVAGPDQTYARIENGAWDCETLTHVRNQIPVYRRYSTRRDETQVTEIFYTDASREVVVFVTLSGEVACSDLTGENPSGYLYAMSDSTRQELTNNARLARYFTTERFLEFCGYCGLDNSLIGAVFGLVFTVSGGGLVLYGRRLRTHHEDSEPVESAEQQ